MTCNVLICKLYSPSKTYIPARILRLLKYKKLNIRLICKRQIFQLRNSNKLITSIELFTIVVAGADDRTNCTCLKLVWTIPNYVRSVLSLRLISAYLPGLLNFIFLAPLNLHRTDYAEDVINNSCKCLMIFLCVLQGHGMVRMLN